MAEEDVAVDHIGDKHQSGAITHAESCGCHSPAVVDLVFAGGGAKVISSLGAFRSIEDAGHVVHRVAGTSAGAMLAAFIAAGYSGTELEVELLNKDFGEFLDSPLQDLPRAVRWPMKARQLHRRLGLHPGDALEEWMAAMLAAKGVVTFGDLRRANGDIPLKVVVTDSTDRRGVLLPDECEEVLGVTADNLAVATALRMSMSVPGVFEPVDWIVGPLAPVGAPERVRFIDGGMVSNGPMWVFDTDALPRFPTLGVMFADTGIGESITRTALRQFPLIGTLHLTRAFEFIDDTVGTAIEATDKILARRTSDERVMRIETDGIGSLDFVLDRERKIDALEEGRVGANSFLSSFCWNDHVRRRAATGACVVALTEPTVEEIEREALVARAAVGVPAGGRGNQHPFFGDSDEFVLAHQGGGGRNGGNRVAVYRRASRLGFGTFDVDLAATADDELVLFHDKELDRLTTGSGLVSEIDADELASGVRYDVGSGRGDPIDLFESLLQEFPRGRFNLEVKNEAAVPLLLERLRTLDARDLGRFCFSASNEEWCRVLRRHLPTSAHTLSLEAALTTAATRRWPAMIDCGQLPHRHRFFDTHQNDLVRRLLGPWFGIPQPAIGWLVGRIDDAADEAEMERRILIWTINSVDDAQESLDSISSDGMLSDNPSAMRSWYDDRRSRSSLVPRGASSPRTGAITSADDVSEGGRVRLRRGDSPLRSGGEGRNRTTPLGAR